MENLELWLSIIGTALSLLITTLVFVFKFIKCYRAKKKMLNTSLLLEAVAPIVEIAEEYVNYSGEEKKQFVLTKVNQFALDNNIPFNADAISKRIEELISLSKKVNPRENIKND